MESPSSGQFEKPPLSASVPLVPLDGVASRDEEATQALRAPWDLQDPRENLALLERRGMMGYPASQDSQDPQGPRVSQGMWDPKERLEWTVPLD